MSTNDKGSDKRPRFFMIEHAVIERFAAEIGPYALAVYTVIVSHVNQKTNVAFPSVRTLARETGINPATVQKAISKLEAVGLLVVIKQQGKNGRKANNHYMLMSAESGTACSQNTDDGVPPDDTGVCHPITQGVLPGNTGVCYGVTHNKNKQQEESNKTTTDAPAGASAGDDNPVQEEPSKTERPRDPVFDAITDVWGTAGGLTARIKSILLGTSRKHKDCNVSPPATPDEIHEFGSWYSRSRLSPPTSPEKVQSWFIRFRELKIEGVLDRDPRQAFKPIGSAARATQAGRPAPRTDYDALVEQEQAYLAARYGVSAASTNGT